jgi:intracellular multiplication protein IcmO
MMAQLLGASLEGDYTEADKPGMGPSPFPVVLDELAYYATSGLDRMLAMGRGLNISFMLGFQEVSGIYARLGEKTASLLGNANIMIAMRQQDSGRTRDYIEKTAGQTNVTQATSYQGSSDGNYREARHAEVRTISRVDWNDLTSLIEGEAIVLFGGRRIYARVFHAKIDDTGPKRIGRSLMLQPPDANELRTRLERACQVAVAIETGQLMVGSNLALSTGLAALLRGFSTTAASGSTAQDCARNALAEIANLPDCNLPARPAPPADGTPVTSLTPMLSVSSKHVFAGPEQAGLPNEPVDDRLLRGIAEIERASGVGETMLRGAGLSILADRDDALAETVIVEPPSMSAEALEMHIKAIIEQLVKLQSTANLKRAA